MAAEAKQHQAALAAYEKSLPGRKAQWEAGLKRKPVWQPLEVLIGEVQGRREADEAARRLVPGQWPEPDAGGLHDHGEDRSLPGITGIRLEVLPDN